MALDSAMSADPFLSEAEAPVPIINKYGAPEEVAAASREREEREQGAQGQGWKWAFFSFNGRLDSKRYIIGSLP